MTFPNISKNISQCFIRFIKLIQLATTWPISGAVRSLLRPSPHPQGALDPVHPVHPVHPPSWAIPAERKKTWVISRWYMENIRKIYGWYMLFDDIQTKHEGHHTHFCVEKEGEHRSSVPTPLTFWPTHIFIVSASTLISGGHINCQRPYGHVTLMPASLYRFHHLESPYWCWMGIALSVSGVLQHGIGFPEFSGVCP